MVLHFKHETERMWEEVQNHVNHVVPNSPPSVPDTPQATPEAAHIRGFAPADVSRSAGALAVPTTVNPNQ